ncbi:hypothetical protein ANCCAN_01009 [Ancylostoma caninum]|uniref:Uncharacterized protein n=1 Tax=Ancylostoma caninum TaxID=29170 RepID=A0A368H8U1_ANCCA|nr:hypothetical protein ANCCAN_01009 [Ancylostoma caninum]
MHEKHIPIFERYDVQRTMECQDEAEYARPSRQAHQRTPQKQTARGMRYRGRTERRRANAVKENKDDAAKRAKR